MAHLSTCPFQVVLEVSQTSAASKGVQDNARPSNLPGLNLRLHLHPHTHPEVTSTVTVINSLFLGVRSVRKAQEIPCGEINDPLNLKFELLHIKMEHGRILLRQVGHEELDGVVHARP